MYAYGVGLNTTRSLIPNGHSLKNHHVDDISAIYSTRMVQKISESFKEPEIKKFSDIADHIRDIQFKTVVSESARFSNGENSIHTLLSEQGNTLKATRVFVLDSEKII